MLKEGRIVLAYVLPSCIVFFLFPPMLDLLPLQPLVLKSLFLKLIILYQPIVIFITCFHYAFKRRSCYWLPMGLSCLIYPADIVVYPRASGLEFYILPYMLVGFIGNWLGHAMKIFLAHLKNRKNT